MLQRRDFDHAILERTTHRPWPMPASPWIMTQSWHDLLFAHWPVDADRLRAKVPPAFALDRYEDQAWLGILPFHMTNVAPRGVPALPGVSAFPELNVRTYVTVGEKPGIYFFSLDAGSAPAAWLARTLFHLPYYAAAMRVREETGWIAYRSDRASAERPAAFAARYRPVGPALEPEPGTLEHFLTERYCLYTLDRRLRPRRLDIHHPPWPLQPAEAEIAVNTMAAAAGIGLPAGPPLLHFSRRQDVVAWPLRRL